MSNPLLPAKYMMKLRADFFQQDAYLYTSLGHVFGKTDEAKDHVNELMPQLRSFLGSSKAYEEWDTSIDGDQSVPGEEYTRLAPVSMGNDRGVMIERVCNFPLEGFDNPVVSDLHPLGYSIEAMIAERQPVERDESYSLAVKLPDDKFFYAARGTITHLKSSAHEGSSYTGRITSVYANPNDMSGDFVFLDRKDGGRDAFMQTDGRPIDDVSALRHIRFDAAGKINADESLGKGFELEDLYHMLDFNSPVTRAAKSREPARVTSSAAAER